MSDDLLMTLLSLSICVPAILVLYKLKVVNKIFIPFFILILVSLLVEIASNVLYYRKISTAALQNYYVLFEFFCWLKFFINLREKKSGKYFNIIVAACVAGIILWVVDNFFISNINQYNLWYKVYYSFVLLLLSLDQINAMIVYRKKSLRKNAVFIICIGLIVFFCYKIFLEVLWNFGAVVSRDLLKNFFTVQTFVNAFVNLLFALAVLWIPTKRYFIKHLS